MEEKDNKEVLREYFSKLGKRGGQTNKEKGPEYFREMQRKAVASRLKNKKNKKSNRE